MSSNLSQTQSIVYFGTNLVNVVIVGIQQKIRNPSFDMNPTVFSHYTPDKQWDNRLKPVYKMIEWVILYQIQYASYIIQALQLVFTLVGGGQTDQSTLSFMQLANNYLYRQDICMNGQYLICMYLLSVYLKASLSVSL